MAMTPERHLARLSWPQVQEASGHAGSTVVWPWGALEQHGPHLPLATDALFAEQVLRRCWTACRPQGRSGACRPR
jgi:creatinine amidohydrolase